jgi:hypothetical protein
LVAYFVGTEDFGPRWPNHIRRSQSAPCILLSVARQPFEDGAAGWIGQGCKACAG